MNGKYWWTDRLAYRPTDKQTTVKQHALPSSKGVGGGGGQINIMQHKNQN